MNISINAISAKVGGGATYLQSILPELARQLGEGHRVIVWRSAAGEYSWPREFEYREDARAAGEAERSASITQRLWFDQIEIPRQLRAERTDVLFSTANFGTLRSPCHQVLLVCNTLPFDRTYLSRLSAKARAHWNLQRQLVMLSIRAADVVIFPTTAIRDLVATYFGKTPDNWIVSNFGTRHDLFRPALEQRNVEGPLRMLHVSLYCEQKNLGTLLEAVKLLHCTQPGDYLLQMTAGFDGGGAQPSHFAPNFFREQALYQELNTAGMVEDLRRRKHRTLPEIYRSSDIFVFPSYTESFGLPLVEAMASGLPIVASDVPVNRELCGDAAIYFSVFDAEDCARAIQLIAEDSGLRCRLREASLKRAKDFTWERHTADLVAVFNAAQQ